EHGVAEHVIHCLGAAYVLPAPTDNYRQLTFPIYFGADRGIEGDVIIRADYGCRCFGEEEWVIRPRRGRSLTERTRALDGMLIVIPAHTEDVLSRARYWGQHAFLPQGG